MEQCANCGKIIGKLETPHVFNGAVVCAACSTVLNQQKVPPPIGSPGVPNPAAEKNEKLGAVIAIAGVVIAVLGFKMVAPESSRAVGVGSPVADLMAWVGIIAACTGALWFAYGRRLRDK